MSDQLTRVDQYRLLSFQLLLFIGPKLRRGNLVNLVSQELLALDPFALILAQFDPFTPHLMIRLRQRGHLFAERKNLAAAESIEHIQLP